MENNIRRYYPNVNDGLTQQQVQERIDNNLVNFDVSVPTKSIKRIISENIFTLFNFINLFLGFWVFIVGSYKNMLFLGVVICNTLISTIQEIRSKKTVDKLSVIAQSKAKAIRSGSVQEIGINDVVLDDILEFNTGNQITTDCIIQEGSVEVDESFITGESDAIYKKQGEMILSGSFVVSGKCRAKVEHIAHDNYTAKISSGAKYLKKVKSEIMESLNKIIKIVSIVIIPVGILLFCNQLKIDGNTFNLAIVNTVAAMIGMIPEGLVLLTSTVLAVSVVRLSKRKVLVQELYCIETLARVDTLCLDKTGTITEGKMEVKDFVLINNTENVDEILSAIAYSSEDTNATIQAVREKYTTNPNWIAENIIPFSSEEKWSGITFKQKGTYIIGAPEFVLRGEIDQYKSQLEEYSKDYRVIILVHSSSKFNNKDLPDNIEVIGFVLIQDKIRQEAPNTLAYFKEQGVDIKIISGDNPATVSNIAKRAGVTGYENYIDASTLKTEQDIKEAVTMYTIFGRVTPTQKNDLIKALKENGHTVAMTGDGVNDVLALKEADCSIAMASGSDAARNVSQIVLLDSNFASMPQVVAEGRRTINNIARSATLFLVKTIYATILALLFLFITRPYPFMPIQLTLISVVTIGIPSFILALEPNKERVKGKFLSKVISKAFPAALTVVINILIITLLGSIYNLSYEVSSTLCVISTGVTGLILLFKISRPFNTIRTILFILMTIMFILGITVFKELFFLVILKGKELIIAGILIIIAVVCFNLFGWITSKLSKNKKFCSRV